TATTTDAATAAPRAPRPVTRFGRSALSLVRRARVPDDTTAGSVEVVAPQRLHGERGAHDAHVGGGALPTPDPRALVAVLGAVGIEPPAAREGISDGFGVLVTLDDAYAVERAVRVDEVRATRRAGVGHVRKIRVGEVPERAARGAVPRAIARPKARRVVVVCSGNDELCAWVENCGVLRLED